MTDILGALFTTADDDEAATIERVALRAGLLWRCRENGCGYTNRADLRRCCGCSAKRPKPTPVPNVVLYRGKP